WQRAAVTAGALPHRRALVEHGPPSACSGGADAGFCSRDLRSTAIRVPHVVALAAQQSDPGGVRPPPERRRTKPRSLSSAILGIVCPGCTRDRYRIAAAGEHCAGSGSPRRSRVDDGTASAPCVCASFALHDQLLPPALSSSLGRLSLRPISAGRDAGFYCLAVAFLPAPGGRSTAAGLDRMPRGSCAARNRRHARLVCMAAGARSGDR